MNAKFSVVLALLAAAGCSHRNDTPGATTSADRTVVSANRGDGYPSTLPAETREAAADARRTPTDTAPKREPMQGPSEARAKTENLTPGTRLTDSGNTETTDPADAITDDSDRNVRDWEPERTTPLAQGNGDRDLTITQQIRRAVMGDETLSFTAKNVKVITSNGKVTLRGAVNTARERSTIDNFARRIAGERAVDDQIEVKNP